MVKPEDINLKGLELHNEKFSIVSKFNIQKFIADKLNKLEDKINAVDGRLSGLIFKYEVKEIIKEEFTGKRGI